ncbi:hypothetical protein [Falsirhodobacter sp. 1013]|uniref:hypothetical protein n=1 Tax=Falsirhodobacter sp. 1013 TaxID=3417566 RepID=UPI003EB9AF6A
MTATIHTLIPPCRLFCDPAPIVDIYRRKGFEASRFLRASLTALALEVTLTDDLVAAGNRADLPRHARKIAGMAQDLGLISLRQTADQVAEEAGHPALPALWARLKRMTEAALDPRRDLLARSR